MSENPGIETAALEAAAAGRTVRPGGAERGGKRRAGPLAVSLLNLESCVELICEGRPAPVMRVMEEVERDMIYQALIISRANIRWAASLLGLKYTTLYAKIKKQGLHPARAVRFGRDSGLPGPEAPGD